MSSDHASDTIYFVTRSQLFPSVPLVHSCLRYAQGIINEGFGQRGAFADIQEVSKTTGTNAFLRCNHNTGPTRGRRKKRALGDGRGRAVTTTLNGGAMHHKQDLDQQRLWSNVDFVETHVDRALVREGESTEHSSTGAWGHFLEYRPTIIYPQSGQHASFARRTRGGLFRRCIFIGIVAD